MEYFSIITQDHWTHKNNAHKEAHEAAEEMNRRIVHEDEVDSFTQEFRDRISEVNEKNKRCKDIDLTVWKPKWISGDPRDTQFSVSGVFIMYLYKAKS